jgi:cytochrome P450
LLAPLAALHSDLGDAFQLPFPGFNPIVLAGPKAARFVYVNSRDDLRWRMEGDPVVRLLRHGMLIEDGAAHDKLRGIVSPALHRRLIEGQVATIWQAVDETTSRWRDGAVVEVLPEMRRIAILCLSRILFAVDAGPDLERIWRPLLRTLAFIGPGPWLVWPAVPRPGYGGALQQMDNYLFSLIAARRARGADGEDLISLLIQSGLSDDLIRDQLLTMLIAGHDTVTALLAWALYALTGNPPILAKAQADTEAILQGAPPTAESSKQLVYLERVVKETLRYFPPIHVSNRLAAKELEFEGWRIPQGTRALFSIFLTHHHPAHWPDPWRFDPDRFDPDKSEAPHPFSYIPFGGGPRFCIGAAMAQIEARVVLARLLQQLTFERLPNRVSWHMGATLEPHGLKMRVRRVGRLE